MNRPGGILDRRIALVVVALASIAVGTRGCTGTKPAGDTGPVQRTFASPEAAVGALVTAMRAHDTTALAAIFGPDSDDLLFSGDPVDDRQTLDRFLQAYDEKHRLVSRNGNVMDIVVGNDDWPMPIPLIRNDTANAWQFDTANGKDEVITRRIGRNELTVIEVCKAICDAQREMRGGDPDHDQLPEYARKFISDPGTTNGLYWPTAEGEPPSPLGAAVADAQGEGYANAQSPSDTPRPYHGYLYRILTAQGKDAPGGAEDYILNGHFIGGFAVVAWPVDYGSSGVMTFVTNYTGDVHQKDLGEDTDKLARAMTQYNPDATWKKAEQP